MSSSRSSHQNLESVTFYENNITSLRRLIDQRQKQQQDAEIVIGKLLKMNNSTKHHLYSMGRQTGPAALTKPDLLKEDVLDPKLAITWNKTTTRAQYTSRVEGLLGQRNAEIKAAQVKVKGLVTKTKENEQTIRANMEALAQARVNAPRR